jgi:hypothetical protein
MAGVRRSSYLPNDPNLHVYNSRAARALSQLSRKWQEANRVQGNSDRLTLRTGELEQSSSQRN